MPRSPLRGVRISCDMDARKASLAALVSCSWWLRSCSRSTRRRASTSSPTQTTPTTLPSRSCLGSADTCRCTCLRCVCENISRSKQPQRLPCTAPISAVRTAPGQLPPSPCPLMREAELPPPPPLGMFCSKGSSSIEERSAAAGAAPGGEAASGPRPRSCSMILWNGWPTTSTAWMEVISESLRFQTVTFSRESTAKMGALAELISSWSS
mmetsp:Transcript_36956/g.97870  ORF Transcript_36956/g.97870 Transcript_36956/m.97870 type:complete len:210 (+) Transcript_36956:1252-1881(+)